MTAIRLCIAGVEGRMGSAVVREAERRKMRITGATTISGSQGLGQSLIEAGLGTSEIRISPSRDLPSLIDSTDVYVSFTTPQAELANIPIVARSGRGIVTGTTGLSPKQMGKVRKAVEGRACMVHSPNFSVGMNVLYGMLELTARFPPGYDVSLLEKHHTGKADAPSGTALKMAEVLSRARGYRKIVRIREGKRNPGELELASLRVGGIPGVHEVLVAGEHEMLRIEHSVFSRSCFAYGALVAAEWVYERGRKGVTGLFSMVDVLQGAVSSSISPPLPLSRGRGAPP